jgi:PadR family transcriptional regulator, regulatory protein AphA
MAELSNTAYVILGFLDARPRTGYEIKQAVDGSTRFFWAASYGQIYPELRRLREAGLVTSERDDAGGRKRTRHRITAAGRRELRRWLAEPADVTELRDEKLLKLFFTRSAGREEASRAAGAEVLAARADEHADKAARLREIEPKVLASGDPYQLAVLRYGIGLNEWGEGHCRRAARDLEKPREETA